MIQIVLDTNILVAGLRSRRGASFALLDSIETGLWKANISVALALEYEAVLKRNCMIPAFDSDQIDRFLHYLFSRSNLPPRVGLTRPALRDPKDDLILEVAIECNAAIVTHNIGDFDRAIMYGVMVMTP